MKNSDKSVFPIAVNRTRETGASESSVKVYSSGITLLEYYSGLAMQGILSNSVSKINKKDLAKYAVEQAYEMIEALNK